MIESVLHFLKIHRKVIFGNSSVIVQDMLRKTPKTFNAVDVIPGILADQGFVMVDGVVLPEPFQRVVASEGVRVVDRALPCLLSNDSHQFFFGHMLHNSRIHLAVALQKAKYNVFTCCTASALPFASAAEVTLVHLHLAVQFASLKLRHMVERFSELLIHAGNLLVIGAQVMREAVRRLLLVKPLHDGNFSADALQRLLFSTALVPASNVSSARLRYLERTAENTLLSSQKVGCATENILSPLCHMDILLPYGYETH